jgi:deoxyribose-phosphate aldolase
VKDATYGRYIDHTVLKPDTTRSTLERFCSEAKKWGFASVCVNPVHVAYVAEELAGTDVKTCAVVGFPLGASLPATKAFEAAQAVLDGATEIDMVMNIGALKDGRIIEVEDDIRAVVEASHPRAIVKVIIETCLLSDDEKIQACELAVKAGAEFVKTSTGFGPGGATATDVALMKRTVGDRAEVKASTGINDRRMADELIAAGASRLGTSKGIRIILDEQA